MLGRTEEYARQLKQPLRWRRLSAPSSLPSALRHGFLTLRACRGQWRLLRARPLVISGFPCPRPPSPCEHRSRTHLVSPVHNEHRRPGCSSLQGIASAAGKSNPASNGLGVLLINECSRALGARPLRLSRPKTFLF